VIYALLRKSQKNPPHNEAESLRIANR